MISSARLLYALLFASLFLSGFSFPYAAQSLVGAPAASPLPMSDASAVDQGIACVLMLVALLVTYLVH